VSRTEKACRNCDTLKPISLFVAKKSGRDGHSNLCRDCHKVRMAEYYLANRHVAIERSKKKHQAIRLNFKEEEFVRTNSRCGNCEKTLPPEDFWVNRSSVTGCHATCKKCSYKQSRIKYVAQREKRLIKAKEYAVKNATRISELRRKNYAKLKADPVRWGRFIDKAARYMANRLRSNVSFRLLSAARNRLWYVLKGTAKSGRTVELLGCTPEELKAHIEKQFKPGWTWADWGPVFEIDHIIPCSKFDMRDPEQQKRCFHYTNLQPLLKEVNRSKWNKIIAA
jgi:hypothetical protein